MSTLDPSPPDDFGMGFPLLLGYIQIIFHRSIPLASRTSLSISTFYTSHLEPLLVGWRPPRPVQQTYESVAILQDYGTFASIELTLRTGDSAPDSVASGRNRTVVSGRKIKQYVDPP